MSGSRRRAGRRYGAAVRLIVTPYLPIFADRIANLGAWMREIEAATGERVWDCSVALTDPGHFADRLHVNRAGSRYFAGRLAEDGFFGSNRATAVVGAARR
jgi:hypothetical protein